MSEIIVGIDLGTTNSLISIFDNEKPRLIADVSGSFLVPSVVSFEGTHIHVGATAKERLAISAKNTFSVFKRSMGTQHQYRVDSQLYDAADLSAMVLRKLKTLAEAELGQEVRKCVISVPAYFNQAQRQATKNAAAIAGLEVLRLINEPTAAALAYGLMDLEAESQFLVVDLGGGTFDVTVLNMFDGVMEVVASSGDAFLGGEDFTDALARELAKKIDHEWSHLDPDMQNEMRIRADAAKTHLSIREQYEVEIKLDGKDYKIPITRSEFEIACEPLLRRMIRPIERCFYDSDISLQDIDRVIMVGGATRMPMVRELITRQLKKFPEYGIDPDFAVALGASVQAALIAENRALEDVILTDVSPFSVGNCNSLFNFRDRARKWSLRAHH